MILGRWRWTTDTILVRTCTLYSIHFVLGYNVVPLLHNFHICTATVRYITHIYVIPYTVHWWVSSEYGDQWYIFYWMPSTSRIHYVMYNVVYVRPVCYSKLRPCRRRWKYFSFLHLHKFHGIFYEGNLTAENFRFRPTIDFLRPSSSSLSSLSLFLFSSASTSLPFVTQCPDQMLLLKIFRSITTWPSAFIFV